MKCRFRHETTVTRQGGSPHLSRHCSVEAPTDLLAAEEGALATGAGVSEPIGVDAKMLPLELLRVKGDLEREQSELVLNCAGLLHWEVVDLRHST